MCAHMWWAWSGDTPFGELHGAPEAECWVHGFAVARYPDAEREYYRFSCTADWEVMNDSVHETEEEAKSAIPSNYDAARVVWMRFEG